MKTEDNFVLEEERKKLFKIMLNSCPTKAGRFYRIILKQDREFLRLLKTEMWNNRSLMTNYDENFNVIKCDVIDNIIEELAGKGLAETKEEK